MVGDANIPGRLPVEAGTGALSARGITHHYRRFRGDAEALAYLKTRWPLLWRGEKVILHGLVTLCLTRDDARDLEATNGR